MRGVVGTGAAAAVFEVAGFFMVADGCLRPLGFGKRDDAVEISLRVERSDGVGDGARCAPFSFDVFTWLILEAYYFAVSRIKLRLNVYFTIFLLFVLSMLFVVRFYRICTAFTL